MRTRLIILSAALQVLVLLVMAGEREWILRTGRIVFLRTAPVDPRDAFRGDYVQLDYEISHVAPTRLRDGLAGVTNPASSRKEQRVYAVLREEDGPARLDFLTDRKPAEGLYLRGFLNRSWSWRSTPQVRYGLEAFFVEQKQGLDLEAARRQGDIRIPLEMEVAVSGSGKAVLKGYRWSSLGIGIKLDTDTNNRPVKATVLLCNVSSNDLAMVDRPEGRSLALEADRFRSWGDNEWTWIHASPPDRAAKDARVVVLPPKAVHEIPIDLMKADWFVAKKDEKPRPVAETDMGDMFRLIYRPPPADACAGLEHADIIWHGEMPSPAFGGWRID